MHLASVLPFASIRSPMPFSGPFTPSVSTLWVGARAPGRTPDSTPASAGLEALVPGHGPFPTHGTLCRRRPIRPRSSALPRRLRLVRSGALRPSDAGLDSETGSLRWPTAGPAGWGADGEALNRRSAGDAAIELPWRACPQCMRSDVGVLNRVFIINLMGA